MNLALPHEEDTNRILVYSALGSLLLHGALLALLALTPKSPVVDTTPPRVQVQLIPGAQGQPITQPTPTPKQPAMSSSIPPPMPVAKPMVSKPTPPVPDLIQHPKPVVAPPEPLPLKKPVLQDSRSVRALQARELTKLSSPSRPSLPPPTQQQVIAPQVPLTPPPSPQLSRSQNLTPSLPPPMTTGPQSLQARSPASTGGATTKPILLTSSKPLYPRVAREAGWEGVVIVRTLIDTEGNPSQTEIQKSSGHPPLDQSAIEAIKTWKFRPAKDGNIPINKWVDIPIKFDLNN